MDSTLIAVLAGITIAAVLIFVFVSKKKTDERRHDADAPKSTLASDAPSHRKHPPDT